MRGLYVVVGDLWYCTIAALVTASVGRGGFARSIEIEFTPDPAK